mmetsp:Transcript_43356/g.101717  ORF Transcript_43356/g.101717 Transcript_43356/m.101717 type:complete len:144 (+) Transcript_43356:384-815(+)
MKKFWHLATTDLNGIMMVRVQGYLIFPEGVKVYITASVIKFLTNNDVLRVSKEEPSCPVLYVYEIHVSSEAQRYGIGRRLMTIMEMTALQCKMKKVILTVFKKNLSAMRFYRERMKYGVDESSPSCYGEEADYEILSKAMCRA